MTRNNDVAGEQKLKDFLSDLASGRPTPGGGAASAVVGSLAASLSSMVANLTVGKEKYQDKEEDFQKILRKATELREEFLTALEEDKTAYNDVMEAYRLPTDTEEKKKHKKRKLQKALKAATGPPFKMAELAMEVLELAKHCTLQGNQHAITDSVGSALLAESTVKTALLNVDINLASIQDEDFKRKKKKKRENLESNARERAADVVAVMDEKV